MGNGAKIALVGVLAMIVAVVAAWDRTNEKKHEEGLQGLPAKPIERPADPPRVRLAPQPAPENHVTGEMTHGLAMGAAPLNREGKTPRVASTLLAGATGASGPRPQAPGGNEGASSASPNANPEARGPRPDAPPRKTHTITKSDTLSKLAEAEYGSKKLWRKIYDANKDVIRNPDSLPVGKNIVIPPAPGAQMASAREPQATTVRPSLSAVTEVTTLPAGDAAAQATYEVVAGDTLGKIALKTLGSKDRWHLIADANKDLLKGGTAVRIGMKLAIPAKPKADASR